MTRRVVHGKMQNTILHPSEMQFRGHKGPNTVARVTEARLPTEFGDFQIIGYRSLTSAEGFIALVRGVPRPNRASLVRIHSQCMTGDVFGSTRCDCGKQLRRAMSLIAGAGDGAIIYQQQ